MVRARPLAARPGDCGGGRQEPDGIDRRRSGSHRSGVEGAEPAVQDDEHALRNRNPLPKLRSGPQLGEKSDCTRTGRVEGLHAAVRDDLDHSW